MKIKLKKKDKKQAGWFNNENKSTDEIIRRIVRLVPKNNVKSVKQNKIKGCDDWQVHTKYLNGELLLW